MEIISKSQDGAYGYTYTVAVSRSSGEIFGTVEGFRWRGNHGGLETARVRLSADQEKKATLLISQANEPGSLVTLADAGDYILSCQG